MLRDVIFLYAVIVGNDGQKYKHKIDFSLASPGGSHSYNVMYIFVWSVCTKLLIYLGWKLLCDVG